MRRIAAALATSLLIALCAIAASPGQFLGVVPAAAQTAAPELDFAAWEDVAVRAEEAIGNAAASDTAYEDLRAELADWREKFIAAQGANAARIETVTRQIAALGPPPGEGESEPAEVADRRAELNAQLEALRAPALRADEAFQRAEGLIREIDKLLAAREAEKLLTRNASPLNPANWAPALSRLQRSLLTLRGSVVTNWDKLRTTAGSREDLPFQIALMVVALALMLRGRVWMGRLAEAARVRFDNELSGFLVSLGEVILPTGAVFLFVRAFEGTGLAGLRLLAILDALPFLVLAVTLALWVTERVFPRGRTPLIIQPMEVPARVRARRLAAAGALVYGLHVALVSLAEAVSYEASVTSVLYFPAIVLEGGILFLLGRLFYRQVRLAGDDERVGSFQASAVSLVARALMAVGVLAPAVAAAGYTNLALRSVYPAGESLLLLGALVVVHRLSLEVHRLLTGGTLEESQGSLVPVLFTALAAIASLPVFALIWGMREASLIELWTQARTGFQIGETRIQPGDFLTFVVVFTVGYLLTRVVQNALRTSILPKTSIDLGGRNAITSGVGYLGIFIAALVAISATGIDLSSLAIVVGALSVGIGFGLQNIVSNFVSGIILLIERPIGEGDWIEVGDHMGIVKSISVRSTRIQTFDRTQVIVPNADFVSGAVVNWTRGDLLGRVILRVGVAYGTDTRKVEEVLREVAMSHEMVVKDPPPAVTFAEFGADSLNFEVRAILYDVNTILGVRNELNHRVNERFAAEGIEIPFAQRDIWLRNPEALAQARAAPAATAPQAPPTPVRDDSAHLRASDLHDGDADPEDGGTGR